jgi:hypothetical protein
VLDDILFGGFEASLHFPLSLLEVLLVALALIKGTCQDLLLLLPLVIALSLQQC